MKNICDSLHHARESTKHTTLGLIVVETLIARTQSDYYFPLLSLLTVMKMPGMNISS